MKSIGDLFDEWVAIEAGKLSKEKINKKEESGAKRSYLHFDLRRPTSSLFSLKKEFVNQDNISSHGFWPFLKKTIITPRIKNVQGGAIGKHKDRKRRKDPKKREVYYASHYDALIYSWYSFLLNKEYEDLLKKDGTDNCVIAYRKVPVKNNVNRNKSSVDFAFEVFDFVKKRGECAVIVSDITSFFDSLDHEILKKEWVSVLGIEGDKLPSDHYAIYNNLTNFKYVDAKEVFDLLKIEVTKVREKKGGKVKIFNKLTIGGGEIHRLCESRSDFVKTILGNKLLKGNCNKNKIKGSKRFGKKCGIMQGAPISATLANIYMKSFDVEMNDKILDIGGLYKRYSDDLIVVCNICDIPVVEDFLYKKIKDYELEINPKKTKITLFLPDHLGKIRGFDRDILNNNNCIDDTIFYKNMQYLGFEYDGQNVFLRSSSLAKYYRKMKSRVKKAVNMAFGKRSKTKNDKNRVFKKMLYKKYLHKGRRSFISYAYKGIDLEDEKFGTSSIKKQLSRRVKVMNNELKRRIDKKTRDSK